MLSVLSSLPLIFITIYFTSFNSFVNGELRHKRDLYTPLPGGQWADWSDYGTCTSTCGPGKKTRNRKCKTYQPCQGNKEETTDCQAAPCAAWTEWGPWSQCSKPCGPGGTMNRTRQCSTYGGCQGPKIESKDCNTYVACANYGQWADWGPCSATCGGGTQSRQRQCKNNPNFCQGANANSPACTCQGDSTQSNKCSGASCPITGPWGAWGDCSQPCGGGTQTRTRPCQTDAGYCTADKSTDSVCKCTDKMTENKNCNSQTCAHWGDWAPWSDCSVTCSKGQQTRKRECQNDKSVCTGGGMSSNKACQCEGSGSEQQPCDKGECYSWSSWSQWSECTTLCGGGSRNRTRGCPVDGGCPGLNGMTDVCNMMPCPDWGDWSPWSDCTVTCGGGQRARTRSCPIPKACSPGEEYESDTTCSPGPCPNWSDWENWSQCSKTCGQGNRKRTRKCSAGDGCLGDGENVEPCFVTACTLSTEWSQWSPCTQTCGGGTQTRSRVKCPAGPPTCPIEQDTGKCSPEPCPLWTNWGAWGACSKTCGGGQRTRTRTCPVTNGCIGQNTDIDGTPCNAFGCNNGK